MTEELRGFNKNIIVLSKQNVKTNHSESEYLMLLTFSTVVK